MSGRIVHSIELERVGGSVIITLGKVTIVLDSPDAADLALGLLKVSSQLAGDTLDEPIGGPR